MMLARMLAAGPGAGTLGRLAGRPGPPAAAMAQMPGPAELPVRGRLPAGAAAAAAAEARLQPACSRSALGRWTSRSAVVIGPVRRMAAGSSSFSPARRQLAYAPAAAAASWDDRSNAPIAAAAALPPSAPFLAFPGGGIFYFWQVGVALAVARHVDLARAPMVGASAGALVAALAACSVDLDASTERAYAMSVEADLWRRPLGLAGVWGGMIRAWLEEVLPEDAAERCRGRVHVLLLRARWRVLPLWFDREAVSDFADREELIEALMASVHIPLFLDGRIFARFRGRLCLDGSFLLHPFDTAVPLRAPRPPWAPPPPPPTPLTAYFKLDAALRQADGPANFVSLTTYEGLGRMIACGRAWAEAQRRAGALEELAREYTLPQPPQA